MRLASTNDTRPTTVHDLNGLLTTLDFDKKEILAREKLFKKFREINTKNIPPDNRIATTEGNVLIPWSLALMLMTLVTSYPDPKIRSK